MGVPPMKTHGQDARATHRDMGVSPMKSRRL